VLARTIERVVLRPHEPARKHARRLSATSLVDGFECGDEISLDDDAAFAETVAEPHLRTAQNVDESCAIGETNRRDGATHGDGLFPMVVQDEVERRRAEHLAQRM